MSANESNDIPFAVVSQFVKAIVPLASGAIYYPPDPPDKIVKVKYEDVHPLNKHNFIKLNKTSDKNINF